MNYRELIRRSVSQKKIRSSFLKRIRQRAGLSKRSFLIEQLESRMLLTVSLTGVPDWVEQGPAPITGNSNVTNIGQNNAVGGAVEAIAVVDTNNIYVATINGGVFRGTNVSYSMFDGIDNDSDGPIDEADELPSWTPLTDQVESLATSAIAVSPLASTTIFVGTGSFSAAGGDGGQAIGILRSTDAGATWQNFGQDLMAGERVRSIVPTSINSPGQVVMAATLDGGGLYRSTDGGMNWALVSGTSGVGDTIDNDGDGAADEAGELNLPLGEVSHLVADPGNANRFYLAVPGQVLSGGFNSAAPGIYRSDNAGATWRQVNTGIPAATLNNARIELAVSAAGTNPVYAAFISPPNADNLQSVFRTTNQGANWRPIQNQANIHPGNQGTIHFSFVADPGLATRFYIAGDRAAASPFAANIFRVDVDDVTPANDAWTSVVNGNANGTAGHADSRDMTFLGGHLIDGNDGGIVRLRNPATAGQRWESMNGNLAAIEIKNIALNNRNNANAADDRIAIGNQDTGGGDSVIGVGPHTFTSVVGGDGEEVAADDLGDRLYFSTQNLSTFRSRAGGGADAAVARNINGAPGHTLINIQDRSNPLDGINEGFDIIPFSPELATNAVAANRLLIGTTARLYESTDAGANFTSLGGLANGQADGVDNDNDGALDEAGEMIPMNVPNLAGIVTTMSAGGRLGGVNNPDVAYIGTNAGQIFTRTAAGGAFTATTFSAFPNTGTPQDIVLDPENWMHAFVVDTNSVFMTPDGGISWSDITGNLLSLMPTVQGIVAPGSLFNTIAFATAGISNVVLVGGVGGVFRNVLGTGNQWSEYGAEMPNTTTRDIEYDRRSDTLIAGTLGRGAWSIASATATLATTGILQICGDENHPNQDDTVRLVRNAGNPTLLDVFLNSAGTPTDQFILSTIQQINVFAAGGNDNLIMDSSNGLINVPDGTRYDGDHACPGQDNAGIGGFDRLDLVQTGGPAIASDQVAPGATAGAGRSLIVDDADNTQRVDFQFLEPIIDTVPSPSFTIASVPGLASVLQANNAIYYAAAQLIPPPAGTVGARVTIDNFEPIEFGNKVTLIVNAGEGNDEIHLNNSIQPTGLTSITVNGGDPTASDTLVISGTAAVDTVTFSPSGNAAGSLTGLSVPVSFTTTEHVVYNGVGGPDSLTVIGTAVDDTLSFTQHLRRGSMTSSASPSFDFQVVNAVTMTGGAGGFDVAEAVGSTGADTITTAANVATLSGPSTSGTLTLGAGVDRAIFSTLGGDDNVNASGLSLPVTVFAGDGNDTLRGSDQIDSIFGGAGNDILIGGVGNDWMYGEDGNDIFGNATLNADGITDDSGQDFNFGGPGFDNFVWEPGDGQDFNNGGEDGADIFRFFGNSGANVFILRGGGTPTHFNALIGAVVIDNHGIEDAIVDGQGGADTFTVDDLFTTEVKSINLNLGAADGGSIDAVTVNGRDAADNIDIASPVAGTVRMRGLSYDVNLTNSEPVDGLIVNGNVGDDVIKSVTGVEATVSLTLNGGLGDDYLSADAVLSGGPGNDLLEGGAGSDSYFGDAGDDVLIVSNGADTMSGGSGFDILRYLGTTANDTLTLSQAGTTITVSGLITGTIDVSAADLEQVNVLGERGNDSISGSNSVALSMAIVGGDGDDSVLGGSVNDSIYGGLGNDILIGGGGADQIYGEEGNDLFGNPSVVANGVADDPGNDQFFGGAGSDTFVWEPGDGSDTDEGGAAEADVLAFFGGAGAEVFNVFAKLSDPARAILFRNAGNITIDMAGIDQINVTGNAGADAYVVGRANNGDSGNVVAPTNPYTDPTASLSDLSTTEVRAVNITEAADAADNVFVDGLPTADNLTVTVESAATSVLRVAGLPYAVRILGANTADRLTVRGNDGNDTIKTVNSTGAATQAVESLIGITLAGGTGNDSLSADAILIGGLDNDLLEGGAGDDQIFGNEGEDTMRGGAGNDTFDGGAGFDTILVNGTTGNDAINVFQSAATTLLHTVNGNTQTDTLVLSGTTRTVERVQVLAGDGNDTIQVSWADALGTDADVNSLRVDVDGGSGATGDRLGVVDVGTGDLVLYQRGTSDDAGAITVGPGNAEPLQAVFWDIETAQPIAAAGGDVVVFKHDPFEFNDARTLATHLGAGDAVNVDPTINPGLDPNFALPADQDWYRLVAERTGVLDFQVYFRQVGPLANGRPGLPNSGNLDIDVTDAAGNVIAGFGTNDANNDERVRIPAVAGQTYYVRVFANGPAINNYNITVDNYAPPTPRDLELLDNPVGDPPPANSDTGRSEFDNITRDNTPTIVFRLDDAIFLNDLPGNNAPDTPPDEVIPIAFQAAAGAAGYRLAIFDEGSSPPPGTQVGTPPQTPLGFATFVSAGVYQLTTPQLSDGSHFLTARVQMVDPANPQQTGFSDRSLALEVIVDTRPPATFFGNATSATDGLLKDSDSGIATVLATFVDRITNDVTPTMYGSAEADAVIRLFVDRTNNGFTTDDVLLGQTVARPIDGTDQHLGEWEISPTTGLNSPDLVATLGQDGVRHLFVTAEDVAGNVSPPAALDILIDTTPPIVAAETLPNGDSVFQLKPTPRPTPPVTSLFVTFTGGPVSAGGFNLIAVDPGLATDVANYQLVGDHNGHILITNAAIISQSDTTVVVRLDFVEPLPDDRFTLRLDDAISDAANNSLDGDSQAQSPGLAAAVLPSGNGIPGGDFIARFTVDSRPEIGAVSEGLVYVDINGNFVWDPEGKDRDATNRDFVFQFGQLVDAHFAGNFAPAGAALASGYDKLGAYGRFAGLYSFILDTDDDGVGDFTSLMPLAYQVNGIPVAGNFNAAHPGDEIGLFDGAFWYLDTNGNNLIDVGERLASNFNGLPIAGDFDGNGTDDLAAFNNSTNSFLFDTNRDGLADFTWNVADDVSRFVGLSGFTDRPVAGDLNLDGIDDIGLWVKDRDGTLPRNSGEYFFWVSDNPAANPANVFNAYSPAPLGNDLYAEFGDDFALPIFGNFDPPVASTSEVENLLHRSSNPADVNGDGSVSPLDALLIINVLNRGEHLPTNDPVRAFATVGYIKVDSSGDRAVSPLDALLVINELNRRALGGGEGETANEVANYVESVDAFFAQVGNWDLEELRKKRK